MGTDEQTGSAMTGRRRGERTERGAAAVEFALIVVPLLYLVFGIISFGYMLAFRQTLSQATAEGARAAAVTPGGIANPDLALRAQNAINSALSPYGVTCAATTGATGSLKKGTTNAGTCKVDTPGPCTGAATDTCVKVTLDYTYSAVPLLPTVGLGILLPGHLIFSTEVRVS